MSEKIYTPEDLKKLVSKTNYEQVKKITDGEIEKAAHEDPDSSFPTDLELKKFTKVKPDI